MAEIRGDVPTALALLAAEFNKLQADVAALKAAHDAHQHHALDAAPATDLAPALTSAALTHHIHG